MSKNSTNSFISLIVGLIIGGILGVLFAPDKGNNTRDRLTFRLNKYKRKLEDLLDEIIDEKDSIDSEAKTQSKKVVNNAKTKAEKLIKDVDGILSKIKEIKITMKNILSILFVSLLVSCGSQVSDLELRVAKLETEIASMRKGGVSSIVLLEHSKIYF